MQRLVTTTGCPTIDAEVALYADVVLRADEDVIVLLRYSLRFRKWYACGCLAVEAAENDVIPNPDFYWRGIGYLENAAYCYCVFDDKPLRDCGEWNKFYNRLAQPAPLHQPRN